MKTFFFTFKKALIISYNLVTHKAFLFKNYVVSLILQFIALDVFFLLAPFLFVVVVDNDRIILYIEIPKFPN